MQFAPGTWRYAAVPAALAVPAFFVTPYASAAALLLAGAVFAFHRDPDREPAGDGPLAPADGRVTVVREEDDRVRVGVFMNVFDVHVNRAPLAGTVESVEHEPGGHRPAFTKESDRNERLHVRFPDYTVTLVAGTFARRIHPYVEAGGTVERGGRIGHVSFGSRADVLLPPRFDRADLRVERGDRVRAGETPLAVARERGGD